MNILYNILQCAVVTFFLSIPETRAVAGEAMIFRERAHITPSTLGQFWTPHLPLRHQHHHGSGPPTPPKMMV